jgi:Tfp pilus assembly protein PilP
LVQQQQQRHPFSPAFSAALAQAAAQEEASFKPTEEQHQR